MSEFTDALADHDAMSAVMDSFFNSLSETDWQQPHGRHWCFQDLPDHLAHIQAMLLDMIKAGPEGEKTGLAPMSRMRVLDAWNDANRDRRPADETGAQTLARLRQTQTDLRAAYQAAQGSETIWVPALRARGWRDLNFVVRYNTFHNWLHLTETHLRARGTVPNLPERVQQNAVRIFVQVMAGAINPAKIRQPFIFELTLVGPGEGVYTFDVRDNTASVRAGSAGHPNVRMRIDLATFFRLTTIRNLNPGLALLTGKMRVRGLRRLNDLGRMFATGRDFDWEPM